MSAALDDPPLLSALDHMQLAHQFLDRVGAMVVRETAKGGDTVL